jgi:hypothetical protein
MTCCCTQFARALKSNAVAQALERLSYESAAKSGGRAGVHH